MADQILGVDGNVNTTQTRRRNTRKPAATRGRQATGRRGSTTKANAIPQASAGVGGTSNVMNVLQPGLRGHMLSDLSLRGYTRQQITAAFPGLGTNW
jgi:hypothetical protein